MGQAARGRAAAEVSHPPPDNKFPRLPTLPPARPPAPRPFRYRGEHRSAAHRTHLVQQGGEQGGAQAAAGHLVMLLQDLSHCGVVDQAPVQQQHQLAMEVDHLQGKTSVA